MWASRCCSCLCSEADAFVAANRLVLARRRSCVPVLGPMMDLKLYIMYARFARADRGHHRIGGRPVFWLTLAVNYLEPQIKRINLEFWNRPATAVQQVK